MNLRVLAAAAALAIAFGFTGTANAAEFCFTSNWSITPRDDGWIAIAGNVLVDGKSLYASTVAKPAEINLWTSPNGILCGHVTLRGKNGELFSFPSFDPATPKK